MLDSFCEYADGLDNLSPNISINSYNNNNNKNNNPKCDRFLEQIQLNKEEYENFKSKMTFFIRLKKPSESKIQNFQLKLSLNLSSQFGLILFFFLEYFF
jgi:hypothetical protein